MAQRFTSDVFDTVYSALDGNVAGLSFYDHVPAEPEGQPDDEFPYAVLRCTGEPNDTDSFVGQIVTVEVHVFSRYRGGKEARGFMDDVYARLNRATLSAAGYKFVDLLHLGAEVFVMEDGVTRNGITRFTLTVKEA